MEIINQQALSQCIRDAVRAELQQHFKTDGSFKKELEERLLSKQELADELGVSLVTLSDWMKKGAALSTLAQAYLFQKKRSA